MEEKPLSHSKYVHLIWFLPLVLLISYLWYLDWDQSDARYWSPQGGPDSLGGFLAFVTPFLFFGCLFILSALALCWFRKTRWIAHFLTLGALVSWASMFFFLEYGYHRYDDSPREKALTELNERFAPVIQGIEQFRKDRGEYPKDLQELIPTYLKEIPSTNLGNFPQCHYLTGEEARKCGENPWVLVMEDPKSAFGGKVVYYPLQNYPPYSHDERVSQIGKWAYIRSSD